MGSSEQLAITAIGQLAAPVEGNPAISLRAGYWRYLQSLSWSESDMLNAGELLELLLYFGRSS
ncbi:MAG: hypothetical protein ACREH3_09850, partial [Geminicoccales bacterium]